MVRRRGLQDGEDEEEEEACTSEVNWRCCSRPSGVRWRLRLARAGGDVTWRDSGQRAWDAGRQDDDRIRSKTREARERRDEEISRDPIRVGDST